MNRRLVCPECAPKPIGISALELRARWLRSPRLWVKVAFSDGETTEHMWFRIVGFDAQDRVIGTLDSLPAVLPMRLGERVAFDVQHVEAVFS